MNATALSIEEATRLFSPPVAADLLSAALSRDLGRPLVTFNESGRVITAGEFRDILSRFVQAISALELKAGARIGLLSRNRPEVLFINGALTFLHACIVPLHPMGSVDDIAYMLEDAGVEALIFDPDHYQSYAAELQRRCPSLNHLLALGETEVGVDLTALAGKYAPQKLPPVQKGPEDIERISYSGGTTGKPKGIMGSVRYGATALDIMLKEWEWPDEVRQLVCAPLSHGGGAMFLPTVIRGGSLVVLPGFEPTAVLEAIQRHRITCVLLVPTMIYALLDHPMLTEYDLSSLEVIYYGASAISPHRLKEGIEKLGPIFFQFYGQAEAPMTVCTLKRREHDIDSIERLASCGRPVPWVRVALLNDAGQPVADGEPGEICVQGPLLMSGYLNQPEQTRQAFEGGWLHTGDMAVMDGDGFLRIVDRKKDMIVTGGFNVFPREVEDVLTSHPAVAAAAVFGVPDEKWGESVRAVVVLREAGQASAEELIALVKSRKGSVQAPKSVEFVPSIPLSGLGKPDKKALRSQFLSGTSS